MPEIAYHFVAVDDDGTPRLGYGDGRAVVVGETLTVEGEPVLCEHGLHWSQRILDALCHVPVSTRVVLCAVCPGGQIVRGDDKGCSQARTCLALVDADATALRLRAFAHWCALSVAHLWKMPDAMRQYLETGDESLRAHAAYAADADAAYAAYAADATLSIHTPPGTVTHRKSVPLRFLYWASEL
jgi:hypothetical protein